MLAPLTPPSTPPPPVGSPQYDAYASWHRGAELRVAQMPWSPELPWGREEHAQHCARLREGTERFAHGSLPHAPT